MLYHGPVRVPQDAREGSATIELQFSPNASLQALPTALTVELAK
jgi:hypothetical protein